MRYLSDGLPGFVRPTAALAGAVPDIFFDYERGLAFFKSSGSGPSQDKNPITNASGGYAQTKSGLWVLQQPNWLRQTDSGALYEESRVWVALWNRDLTNVVWTKTSTTAANDQTGVDGAANSASSLTATAGNGTCLQAITLASSARWQSAFVKRITGSGVVEMTMDNGTTWTAITVGAEWGAVEIPGQTLANPTVGFRIVTSGDAIAIDFVGNENGTSRTSPVLVQGTAATRNADAATGIPITVPASWTMMVEAKPQTPTTYGTQQIIASIDTGASTDRSDIFRNSTDGSFRNALVIGNAGVQTLAAGTWAQDTLARAAVRMDVGNRRLKVSGVAGGNGVTTYTPPAWSTLYVGQRRGPAGYANGLITKVAVWGAPLSDAAMDGLAP